MSDKILLGLDGKRITFAKLVSEDKSDLDDYGSLYPDTAERKHVMIEYAEEAFEVAKAVFSYYDEKSNTVRPMKSIAAKVDKTSIEANAEDVVTFTVKTNEDMQVMVNHDADGNKETSMVRYTSVDGKVTVKIVSDCLGTMTIAAMGDTVYTTKQSIEVV